MATRHSVAAEPSMAFDARFPTRIERVGIAGLALDSAWHDTIAGEMAPFAQLQGEILAAYTAQSLERAEWPSGTLANAATMTVAPPAPDSASDSEGGRINPSSAVGEAVLLEHAIPPIQTVPAAGDSGGTALATSWLFRWAAGKI